MNRIPDAERLDRIGKCLKESALQWYLWTEDQYAFKDWNDFKIQIGQRFSHMLSNKILHQFLDVVLEGSVIEYDDD